jgi:hypothetical protein
VFFYARRQKGRRQFALEQIRQAAMPPRLFPQEVHDELVFAPGFIQGNPPPADHFHAVFRGAGEIALLGLEEHRFYLGSFILEGKIEVP